MPTTDLFEIDPKGVITINGEVIVMQETDANYQKYLQYLESGGTVYDTQVIAPFTPPPCIDLKG